MTILFILAVTVFLGDMIRERFMTRWLQQNLQFLAQQEEPQRLVTGLQILRQFAPPNVTIRENPHPGSRGAMYYGRSQQIVVATQDFDRSDFDTVWRVCHELRHPQQTTRFWRRMRSLKIMGEIGYGLSLACVLGSHGMGLCSKVLQDSALPLFVLASLSYFFRRYATGVGCNISNAFDLAAMRIGNRNRPLEA